MPAFYIRIRGNANPADPDEKSSGFFYAQIGLVMD
jgi:hypothetical protein